MAGIVGLTELQHTSGNSAMTIDASGNLTVKTGTTTVKGEGTATTNLQQGLAKNWVSFDGTASTLSFEDSFNSASLTDNGTGNYSVNFTSAMANGYFSCVASCFAIFYANTESRTTARYRIRIANTSDAAADREGSQGAAFGDLA